MSGNMSWPESEDPATPDGEAELREAVRDIQDRRISVGSAYRRVSVLPDFVVLWQIGRRKTAIAMAAGWLALLAAVWAAVATQIEALALVILVAFIVMVVASWIVFAALEDWTLDYNDRLDDEVRRLLGRSGR
jgi:fatty acid desaturase